MKNRIYVIGMGPGKEEMMTMEALHALEQSDVIVGYTVYIKLLGERFANKTLLTTPMRQEEERCRLCFEEAGKGYQVSLICSGDAGIYGLASLMYEVEGIPGYGSGCDSRNYSGKQRSSSAWSTAQSRFLCDFVK